MEEDRILNINIENEMKSAYIDYSMSVIVSRALPDVRDGLKPVHRRVLFGMDEMGNNSDKPFKKAAKAVGEVMGNYHPHGDSSIYGTVVRMAQPWAMRYCLVEGHGNFGSIDGDGPAAMRYTEVRLEKMGEAMMTDINSDTVDFQPNYDNQRREPVVLPSPRHISICFSSFRGHSRSAGRISCSTACPHLLPHRHIGRSSCSRMFWMGLWGRIVPRPGRWGASEG